MPTITLFKDFTDEILQVVNTVNIKTFLLNKTNFFDEINETNYDLFCKFLDEKKLNIPKNIYDTTFRKMINAMGGFNYPINIEGMRINFTICNAWSTPFNTMHTQFHELSHALQERYRTNKQFNKGNGYLDSYVIETQPNLFANVLLLLKAMETKNEDIIKNTKEKIKKNSLNSCCFECGYFDYPITVKILGSLQVEDFYKSNKIDIERVFKYTHNLVLEKRKEYEDFFQDSNNFEFEDRRLIIKNNEVDYQFIKDLNNFSSKKNNQNETNIDKLNLLYDCLYRIKRVKKELEEWQTYFTKNIIDIKKVEQYKKELQGYKKSIEFFNKYKMKIDLKNNELNSKLDKFGKELEKNIDSEIKKYK